MMEHCPSKHPKTENEHMERLDAIVVLGNNISPFVSKKEIRREPTHLSTFSKLNVLATGILYQSGFANNLHSHPKCNTC